MVNRWFCWATKSDRVAKCAEAEQAPPTQNATRGPQNGRRGLERGFLFIVVSAGTKAERVVGGNSTENAKGKNLPMVAGPDVGVQGVQDTQL